MDTQAKEIIGQAQRLVIIQADNPDADSLASSLALEQILGEMGKDVWMYCGVDMPNYLKYLPGWDRVMSEMPSSFDASIIVDASTMTLLDKPTQAGHDKKLSGKPCLVLDHHKEVDNPIDFATVTVNEPTRSSTGELIYSLAKKFDWTLDKTSAEFIMTSILGDTQGLSNDLTSAETYRVMAELVDLSADRPKLEEQRRAYSKMPETIFRYKAKLIERTEFHHDNKIALVTIPQKEITDYSPLYNPNPLIQGEHLQTENVLVSIALKSYDDGKITAAIRCNTAAPIAAKLAEHFGGGGHEYSSGFKVTDGRSLDKIKSECIQTTNELLN